jgi:predicted ribosome-associated RNA-binding protein Tma20
MDFTSVTKTKSKMEECKKLIRSLNKTKESSFESEMIETEENGQERQILIVDDSAYNLFVLEELIKSIFQDNDKIIIKTALNG